MHIPGIWSSYQEHILQIFANTHSETPARMVLCSIISIEKDWKWPKRLLHGDWLSELGHIHTVKHYAVVTKNVKHVFIRKTLQGASNKKCKRKTLLSHYLWNTYNTCTYTHVSYILTKNEYICAVWCLYVYLWKFSWSKYKKFLAVVAFGKWVRMFAVEMSQAFYCNASWTAWIFFSCEHGFLLVFFFN